MNEILVWLLTWGGGQIYFFNTPTPTEKPNESLVNNCATTDRSWIWQACIWLVGRHRWITSLLLECVEDNSKMAPIGTDLESLMADISGQKIGCGITELLNYEFK